MNQTDEELFPEMIAPPPAPVLVLQDDIEDDEDFIEDEDPLIPEVTERQKIDTTEIFKKPSKKKNIKPIIKDVGLSDEYNDDSSDGHMSQEPPSVKAITEPETLKPNTISEEFDNTSSVSESRGASGNSRSSSTKSKSSTTSGAARANKNGKPKRVMSEAQKAKLAEARAKALAVRKANAEKRKQEREEAKMEKDLEKQVRTKKINKMKSELNDEVVSPTKPVQQMFSQQDLDNAILKGIAGYDKVRKAQKEEKKKRKEEEEHKKKIFNTISNAVGTGNPEIDMWSVCFQ